MNFLLLFCLGLVFHCTFCTAGQTAEHNVNNFESNTERAVEGLQSVDDRRVLNAAYPLQENVHKSKKRVDNRIRSSIKRAFTLKPKPPTPGPRPTNSGQAVGTHVAFTVALCGLVICCLKQIN